MEDVNKSIELIELKNGNNPGPLSMILDPPPSLWSNQKKLLDIHASKNVPQKIAKRASVHIGISTKAFEKLFRYCSISHQIKMRTKR